MKNQDTFLLTAIKEDISVRKSSLVKLPKIKSQISYRRNSMTGNDLISPSSSRSIPKTSKQANVMQDFFKTISDRASKSIQDLYASSASELIDNLKTIEKSKHVQKLILDLQRNVMKKKTEYNSLMHTKLVLQKDINLIRQKIEDLILPEKNEAENEKQVELLEKQLEALQNRIVEETLNSEVLNHMAGTRKKWLDDIEDPTRALKKKILHLNIVNQTMDREAEYHVLVARNIRSKVEELKEKIESKREYMQAVSSRELDKYENRYKAIEFYKQSKVIWQKKKHLESKKRKINILETHEKEIDKEKNLLKRLEVVQQETAEKEGVIAKALRDTKLNSLNELSIGLIQIKDTRENLVQIQKDLEQRIISQKKEIDCLNEEYQKMSLSLEKKKEFGFHALYMIEKSLASQEVNVDIQEGYYLKSKEICSAGLLGLNRLVDIVGGAEEARNFRTIKDFIDFICSYLN